MSTPELNIQLAKLLSSATQNGIDLGPLPQNLTQEWLDQARQKLPQSSLSDGDGNTGDNRPERGRDRTLSKKASRPSELSSQSVPAPSASSMTHEEAVEDARWAKLGEETEDKVLNNMGLLDFQFLGFVTPTLVRALYKICVILLISLWFLGNVFLFWELLDGRHVDMGEWMIALSASSLSVLLAIVLGRIGCEMIFVIFRIEANTRE